MERVVVLGPAGAGKTELAHSLSRRTGLPVVHLDPLFWREEWRPAPREEALRDLEAAIAEEQWIMDGNFLAAGDSRFDRADTVIFLDLPRATCFRRVLWRLVRDRRRSRADLPRGSREGFDADLVRWIWRYPRVDRPRVVALLAGLDPEVTVHHLRSRSEARSYVESISGTR